MFSGDTLQAEQAHLIGQMEQRLVTHLKTEADMQLNTLKTAFEQIAEADDEASSSMASEEERVVR